MIDETRPRWLWRPYCGSALGLIVSGFLATIGVGLACAFTHWLSDVIHLQIAPHL